MKDNTAKIIAEGKYLRFMQKGRWEYVERVNICGIVGIAAITEDRKIILTEQFRTAVNKRVIELPAGLAGDLLDTRNEDLVNAAHRELYEETGYEAGYMELICEGPPSAGTSNELITIYIAGKLKKTGSGGGDETESITVHEVPLEDIDAWLHTKQAEGFLIDLRIYTGLYFIYKYISKGKV